ncbi:hypothetical protein ACQ4PT_010815 [Festuca glaucescens]
MELGTGLRIIDCDRDTMSMIAVVPKFQYFQLFVHHSDMDFDTGNIDDVVISGSPVLPAVLSPKCRRYEGEQHQKSGQEPRRSRRNLMEEDVENCSANGDSDSDDTDCDQDWVDSDNEVAEDDDDLYEEWVDDKGKNQRRSKSKMEQDSDYDTEDLEELEGSDVEEEKSGDEVVIVDKQGRKKTKKKVKGLINDVNALWPDAAHRFCVRHLHQNFAKHWRGDVFKNKLWQIARATREVDWQQYMDEMKALDQDAYEYLEGIDPRQWCKAFFDDLPKCDLLLNTICEVFNKYILDAREMPVVTCLKKIMNQLMIRFVSKRKETEDMCGTICPKIRKKLDKNIDFAVNYGASPAAEQLFKVEGLRGEYEVNIQKLECTCRAWQVSGIPCRHACAVFRHERIKPESVVHKCYSIDAFKAAYGQVIMPCSDPKVWPKMNGPAMRPPKFDKQVGRPSKKRRRSALEEEDGTRMSRHGIVGHCSICNSIEHNKRKCPRRGEYAAAQEEHAPAQEEHAPAAQEEYAPAAEEDIVPVHVEPQPQPIQVVLADEELLMQAQPPQKMAVKRNNAAKKKTLPVQKTSAGASIVQSVMSYDISESTSVINILQEQALATQQSQTPVLGPLPESQFIARCRDDLPPRRPATLGLKRKKPLPKKKKENMLPNV